jgi:hypothetical protein
MAQCAMTRSQQSQAFFCGSPAMAATRNNRGWKPLPQKQNQLDDKAAPGAMALQLLDAG